ncbi:MAG: hypothetical protein QXH27_02120 [Candidatus Micrarchaeia archaeon]
MAQPIVLDTSFLVSAAKYRLDLRGALTSLFGAFELVASERVIAELSALASSSQKDAPHARAALALLANFPVCVVPTNQPVDDWIVESAARDPSAVVATVDRELRRKLKDLKVRVLTVKGRKKIELE